MMPTGWFKEALEDAERKSRTWPTWMRRGDVPIERFYR